MNEKSGELRIDRVESFDDGSIGVSLSNGNYIALELNCILGLPGFNVLAENERFMNPRKSDDRKTVYWRDGPRPLGIDELLSLIGKIDSDGGDTKYSAGNPRK